MVAWILWVGEPLSNVSILLRMWRISTDDCLHMFRRACSKQGRVVPCVIQSVGDRKRVCAVCQQVFSWSFLFCHASLRCSFNRDVML